MQYIPVDDSKSAPAIRAAEFRILHVANILDAADSARSTFQDRAQLYGAEMAATLAQHPPTYERLELRKDFNPQARIFGIASSSEGPFVRAEFDMTGIKDMELRVPETLVSE